VKDALFDSAIGCRKGGVDVAFAGRQSISDVVAERIVNYRTARRSFFNIRDDGQLFVVDHDEVNCVSRGVTILSNNRGDRMAHEVDLVRRQHAMIGNFQVGQRARAGNWPDFSGDVVARVDGHDAGRRTRCFDVDAIDLRVRVV
jgi:hypothetical protein